MGLGLTFTGQDRLSPVLKNVSNQMNMTRDASGRLQQGMGKFTKGGGAGGGMFGQMGGQAQAAGLAMSGGFAYGLNEVTQESKAFEVEMARVSTVVDSAAFSTEDARNASMKLAEQFGGRAVDQGASLYETFSAGVTNAADALALMDTANRFAVGGSTDLVKSVDVLTSAVNTYGDQGLSAAAASDLMFTAISAGKTTAGELSQYLGEVAPTAHAAGVSFQELQAGIAALTLQGIRTPQAVTGLNAMLSNLMKPTKEAADEAKRLGIEFNATALKTRGLEGVLDQLQGNAKVNDSTFTQLFGSIDGVKAALALTAGGGEKFKGILKQMEGATGATNKAFDKMSNTQDFVDKQFTAMKTNAMILIGDALLPLKRDLVDMGKKAMKAWGDLPQGLRDTAVRVAAVVASIGSAGAAFSMLGGGVSSAFGPALKLITSFGATGIAIFGALALGAAALQYAYDNNLGGIADTIDGVLDWVTQAYDAAVQLFTTGALEGSLAEAFAMGDSSAAQFAVDLWLVVQRVKNFFAGISEGWYSQMEQMGPIFETFMGAVTELGNALGLLGNGDASESFDAAGSSGQQVGKILAQVAGVIVSVWTVVVQLITGFLSAWDAISPAADEVGAALGSVMDAFGEVGDAIAGGSTSTTTFGEKVKWLGNILGQGLAGSFKMSAAGFEVIAGIIRKFAIMIGGVIDVVGGIMNGDWGRIWKGAGAIVFSFVSTVLENVFALVRGVLMVFDKLDRAMGRGGNLTAGFDEFAKNELATIKENLMGPETPAAPDLKAELQTSAADTAAAKLDALGTATSGNGDQAAATASAAAAAAVAGLPPVAATVIMTVDGAVLGEAVVNAQLSAKGRDATAVPVTP
jgi:TP901 family phage tail tape measure protein